jgi:hypothetical protein
MSLQLGAVLSDNVARNSMRVPDENLDDFKSKPEPMPVRPVRQAPLRFTGEVEVLKPVARWEGAKKSKAAAGDEPDSSVWFWLSWFHRSLAMGVALSVITFVLGTAIYIAVYGPPSGLTQNTSDTGLTSDDLSTNYQSGNDLTQTGTPDASDSLPADSTFNFNEPHVKRIVLKHRPTAHHITHVAFKRVLLASNRSPHQQLRPQFWVSQFVPTTLVVYIDHGEVRTRIEPQNTTY